MCSERERTKEKILVSACLLGTMCRYDGGSNALPELGGLRDLADLIPFCPEVYGGLPTPRMPSEIRGNEVYSKDGHSVTEKFGKGATEALKMAKLLGCRAALLKERSPSCGCRSIYDGTFSGTRIAGMGVAASLLAENGIQVFSDEELRDCIRWLTADE